MSENSDIFKLDKSRETDIKDHFFFNKNTEIIKQNQPLFATFEQEKKTFYQTYQPKLYILATKTGRIAEVAGKGALNLLNNGFWWAYQKFTNNVIPTTISTIEQLSKLLSDKFNSRRGIMPIEQQKSIIYLSFSIDIDDEETLMQTNIMIPSQSIEFEFLYDQTIAKNMQCQPSIQQKKIIHKLPNCLQFYLQGKNSIQYDMLDGIQKNQKCQSSPFTLSETLAKQNSSRTDPSGECPLQTIQQLKKYIKEQEAHEQKKYEIKNKIVDNTRNVKVQIQPPIYIVQSWEENKKLKVMFS